MLCSVSLLITSILFNLFLIRIVVWQPKSNYRQVNMLYCDVLNILLNCVTTNEIKIK